MRRGLPRSAFGAILLLAGAGGAVASDAWGAALAETFRAACVPERLSYEGPLAEQAGFDGQVLKFTTSAAEDG